MSSRERSVVVVSAEHAVDELGLSRRDVLRPGPRNRLLRSLRTVGGLREHLGIPRWFFYVVVVVIVGVLGAWGFHRLSLSDHLSWPQSVFRALKLFTLDTGPAGGPTHGGLNWQLYAAFTLAALVVMRAVFGLVRAQVRRWVAAHLLSRHVIVCGAGVHGTQVTKALSADHDVVLVDLDPRASGLSGPPGDVWRLVGDATVGKTLENAGVGKAAWLIAITGDDYVNSQIVSALETVKRCRRGLHVLVQVENPGLARFLEDSDEAHDVLNGKPGTRRAAQLERQSGKGARQRELVRSAKRLVIVSSFSPNGIAAEALLDQVGRTANDPPQPGTKIEEVESPHLIVAGDHPVLDLLVLVALRRMRARVLRQHEVSGRPGLASDQDSGAPALRIGVYGPGAVARVERLERRWVPESQVLQLEAKDIESVAVATAADDWLRKQRGHTDHVFVACLEELDAVVLTLGISNALGSGTPLTRLTAEPASHLDRRIEGRTRANPYLATTMVLSLAELGCDRRSMSALSARDRLVTALEAHADRQTASRRAEQLFDSSWLGIHSDQAWRVTPSELALVAPLVNPVRVSALVRAGVAVNLDTSANLRIAARRLSRHPARQSDKDSVDGALEPATNGYAVDAFVTWCEYVRRVVPTGDDTAGEGPPAELRDYIRDEIADRILRLRQAALGERSALTPLSTERNPLEGAHRAVIFATGSDPLTQRTADRIQGLLQRALAGYEGELITRQSSTGLAAIVDRVAGELTLRAVRYGPPAAERRRLYRYDTRMLGADEVELVTPFTIWWDILSAGVPVDRVSLIACPGTSLVYAEIVLARALGARIAWFDPSAELPLLLDDLLPFGADGVLQLPADAMTLRAFLHRTQLPRSISAETRGKIARCLHGEYLVAQRKRKASGDAALAPWERLTPTLQRSNLAQADDIPNKLKVIGKRLAPNGSALVLSEHELNLLAEIEHGRYNVERLEAGWQVGERHIRGLSSPYLKPWDDLSDDVRAYDREAVLNINPALQEVGWGVADASHPMITPRRQRSLDRKLLPTTQTAETASPSSG